MVEMKPVFRDAFRDNYQSTCGQSVDSLDDARRSIAMTRFYVSNVLAALTPGKAPDEPEDLEACVTDGSKDAGCDFFFRSDDGRVLIIQSKYRKKGKEEDPAELSAFCDILERIHPEFGKKYPKNRKVIEAGQDIDWDNDSFELIYLTLARVNQTMRAKAESRPRNLPGIPNLADRVEIRLIDEEGANDELRNAISAQAGLREPITIQFDQDPDGKSWIKHEGPNDHVAYVGIVSAKTWRELSRFRERLFNLNIRNYLGDNRTNDLIRETAESQPEDFFFFNNGVAAVATKVKEIDQRSIQCDQFSIVNGAQTVRSLIKAHKNKPQTAGQARVLLRVTTVRIKEAAFLDNITKYNNTQNPVRISDFRSNDPIQRALASRFSQLARAGGKAYVYKNKRSEPDARKIAIGMEEFAQTIHAFKYGTVDAFGGKPRLFDLSSEGRYAFVFGDGKNVWNDVNDDEFALMAGIWFLCSEARELIKDIRDREIESARARGEDERAEIVKAALERRWTVYSAIGALLREKYLTVGRDLDGDLRKLSKPDWLDKKGALYEALNGICEVVGEVLVKCYRAAKSKQGFAQRNWYRSREALVDIRNEILDSKSILRHLPLLTTDLRGAKAVDVKS